ncbi:MAG: GNAT family N-acetyltransferase [Betaproteobacteria bacterium]
MNILLSESLELPQAQVIELYAANGWSSAKKPTQLLAALRGSHSVVTAWEGEILVGLGNALSDGHLVVYYPHLLVLPAHHGRGIGALIMQRLKLKYAQFHQHILVSDSRTTGFYAKSGFEVAGATQSMWIYGGDDH